MRACVCVCVSVCTYMGACAISAQVRTILGVFSSHLWIPRTELRSTRLGDKLTCWARSLAPNEKL